MKRLMACFILFFVLHLPGQTPVLEKTILFGNAKTRSGIVLRELNLRKGFPVSNEQILREKAWFLRRNFFRRIQMETAPGAESHSLSLILLIREKSPWSFDPILSQNLPFGWIAGGRLWYDNLFGRKEKAGVLFQIGAVNQFGLSWQEPWFLGSARFFAEGEAYTKRFRYMYNDHPVHFLETDQGIRFTMGKAWGRMLQTGVIAGMESIRVSDPSVMVSGKNNEPYSSLEAFCQFDSRDWPAYPFSGAFCRMWNTWTAVRSRFEFSRTGIDARFYWNAFRNQVLAFQTMAEISDRSVPVVKRLHIGGGKTLRGIDNGSLAGDNTWIVGAEYRMPILFEKNDDTGFRFGYAAVAFADLGAAWYDAESLSRNHLIGSVGFGFHGIWSRLVLRLEWGTRGKGLGFITTGTGVKF